MASYQDLDVRMSVVEDKIDMIMKSFSVTKRYQSILVPGQEVVETRSLYDLYREIKTQGLIQISPEEAAKSNATMADPFAGDDVKKDDTDGNA